MSPRSKKEYIEAIYLRYKNASRKQKLRSSRFCATLKLHRKHAIRLLKKFKRFRRQKTKSQAALLSTPTSILKPSKKSGWSLTCLAPAPQSDLTPLDPWLYPILRPFASRDRKSLIPHLPSPIDRILSPPRPLQKKRAAQQPNPEPYSETKSPSKQPME